MPGQFSSGHGKHLFSSFFYFIMYFKLYSKRDRHESEASHREAQTWESTPKAHRRSRGRSRRLREHDRRPWPTPRFATDSQHGYHAPGLPGGRGAKHHIVTHGHG